MLTASFCTFNMYLPASASAIYTLLRCHLRDLFSRQSAQLEAAILHQYAAHILYYIREEYDIREVEVLKITLQLCYSPTQPISVRATYVPLVI